MAKPATQKYVAKFPVKHDKVLYAAGKTIEMTPEQASPLLRRGTLQEVDGSAVDPNADLPTPALGETKPLDNTASRQTSDPTGV